MVKRITARGLVTAIFVFANLLGFAAEPIAFHNFSEVREVIEGVEFLVDDEGKMSVEQVAASSNFAPLQEDRNFRTTDASIWLKFSVANRTETNGMLLELAYPILDEVELYVVNSPGNIALVERSGEKVPISARRYKYSAFVFPLEVDADAEGTYLLKIRSQEQIMVPLRIGSVESIPEFIQEETIKVGVYIGIILIMFLYNLFLFFSVKDRTYLYYVAYIAFVGLTQASTEGYTYKFLWPDMPWLANQSNILLPVLVGITAVVFERRFLLTAKRIPKIDKGFFVLMGLYTLCGIGSLAGFTSVSFTMTQAVALLTSLYMLFAAYVRYRQGSRQAKFFLWAWSVFLIGVVIFVLKDFAVIPYNNYTRYVLHIGSAFEVSLLSFALADKINQYKKDKADAQRRELAALQENKRIITRQNETLESLVDERTAELSESNANLSRAMEDLKNTQSQLVESEKMASLGQLTAGIAHEINNPVNFIRSNIGPLKRDVLDVMDLILKFESATKNLNGELDEVRDFKEEIDFDYLKTEIDMLLKDIENGADRTAEIVKGLQLFSRLDESDLKMADINDCLDATIRLLRSNITKKVQIRKEFGDIPNTFCYPGKLNQVFMNILNNAVQAVAGFREDDEGFVSITTERTEDQIRIAIKDNGGGIPDEIREKIFDPFFTTKEVGSGTGLGLSIVYKIISNHNGSIDVDSEVGVGTTFNINIPIMTTIPDEPISDNDGKEKEDQHLVYRR